MVYSGKVLQGYNEGKVSSLCHTVSALKFSPHVAKPSETGTLFVCLFVYLFVKSSSDGNGRGDYLAYVFVFPRRVVVCLLDKLALSDQFRVTV